MLFTAYLGDALKNYKPIGDDTTIISCNDYIPFNFDSKPICLSMQNMDLDNRCNIVLPTSIQLHFDTFAFNDNNVSFYHFWSLDTKFANFMQIYFINIL